MIPSIRSPLPAIPPSAPLGLALLALLAPASCKNGPSGPTNPFAVFPPCEPSGPPPDSTWFDAFDGNPAPFASGNGVTWDRPAGLVTFSEPPVVGFIEVAEPSTFVDYFGCAVPVISAEFMDGPNTPFTYTWDREHELFVVLDHLSQRAISGFVKLTLYKISGADSIPGRIDIDFDVADGACSLPNGFPASGYYEIDDTTALYNGVETRWSRSIGSIALGEDTDADSLSRWGMNLWVKEPVRTVGTEQVLTLARAEFTTASDASGTNVRFFVFPPEAGFPTNQNDLLKVISISDGVINASAIIPMQRQTFSPTGGTMWHETIDLEVCFEAWR